MSVAHAVQGPGRVRHKHSGQIASWVRVPEVTKSLKMLKCEHLDMIITSLSGDLIIHSCTRCMNDPHGGRIVRKRDKLLVKESWETIPAQCA